MPGDRARGVAVLLLVLTLPACASLAPQENRDRAEANLSGLPAEVLEALEVDEDSDESLIGFEDVRTSRDIGLATPEPEPVSLGGQVARCLAVAEALAGTGLRAYGRLPARSGSAATGAYSLADEQLCRRGLTDLELAAPAGRTATSTAVRIETRRDDFALVTFGESAPGETLLLSAEQGTAALDRTAGSTSLPVSAEAGRTTTDLRFTVPEGQRVRLVASCRQGRLLVSPARAGSGAESTVVRFENDDPRSTADPDDDAVPCADGAQSVALVPQLRWTDATGRRVDAYEVAVVEDAPRELGTGGRVSVAAG